MLNFVCIVLFVLYVVTVYLYSSSNFLNNKKLKKLFVISTLINSIFLITILSSKIIIPEAINMILYLIAIWLEINLTFNNALLKNFFNAIAFTVVFFSIKIISTSLNTLINGTALSQIYNNFNSIVITLILLFVSRIIYIILSRKLLNLKKYIDMLSTDKNNMKFSVVIIGSIYTYLIVNTYILYVPSSMIPIINIKIGIFAIIGTVLSIIYAYLFSKFHLYSIKAENIEKELINDKLAIEKLKNEVLYDDFTSCFKREFIEEQLTQLLEKNKYFCVVFIDIDGLKITNDLYGHDEGDFYIKTVSKILNEEFPGKIIGRMGGDEFLVILENIDVYVTTKYVVRCYEKVGNISKIFEKPYQTSISYGIVEVNSENNFSKEEIINLADIYMYNFKKSRKKNRA